MARTGSSRSCARSGDQAESRASRVLPLVAKADELDRTVRKLSAMRDGLRRNLECKQGLRRDGDGAGGLGGREPCGALRASNSNRTWLALWAGSESSSLLKLSPASSPAGQSMRRRVASSGKGTVLFRHAFRARAAAYCRSWNPLGSNRTAPRLPGRFFLGCQRNEGLAFHKAVTFVALSVRFSSKIGEPAI